MAKILSCNTLVEGTAEGEILKTHQTISFWGGVDPATGKIIDPRHELFDQVVTGKVLVFPFGKGSAAAPLVLLELVRQNTAPVAIVNVETDPLLVAGPIISKYFYSKIIPTVQLSADSFDQMETGQAAVVNGRKNQIKIKDTPSN